MPHNELGGGQRQTLGEFFSQEHSDYKSPDLISSPWDYIKSFSSFTSSRKNDYDMNNSSDVVGSDIIGQWLNNAFSGDRDYKRQKELMQIAMDYNSAEAAKARAYDSEMANTAVQRRVADLRAAGFNPALAVSSAAGGGGGSGASIGTASAGTSGSQATQMSGDLLSIVNSAVASAGNVLGSAMSFAKLAAFAGGMQLPALGVAGLLA